MSTTVSKAEAMMFVCPVCFVFFQFGLSPDKIGVITPLRYQQTLLKRELASLNSVTDLLTPEVNTIDKYQGRDKECIIISFVRSNSKGAVSVYNVKFFYT